MSSEEDKPRILGNAQAIPSKELDEMSPAVGWREAVVKAATELEQLKQEAECRHGLYEMIVRVQGIPLSGLRRVGVGRIDGLGNSASALRGNIESQRKPKDGQQFDKLVARFEQLYAALGNAAVFVRTLAVPPDEEAAAAVARRTDGFRSEVRAMVDATKAEANKAAEEANTALVSVRETLAAATASSEAIQALAAEAGVTKHAVAFRIAAERNRSVGAWWLVLTAILAVFVLIATLYAVIGQPTNVQAISTAVLVSVLLTFALIAARNHRIQEHNALLNEQKQNALSTLDAFAKALPEGEARSAVLLQATEAIFQQAPTAPGGDGRTVEEPTSALLALVRELKKGGQ